MAKQLHKRFTVREVVEILEKYLSNEIGIEHATALLKIGRSRLFELVQTYRKDPDNFTLQSPRTHTPRKIDERAEKRILCELEKEACLIADRNNPVRDYNYSYLKEVLEKKHKVVVSLPTIIRRAKKGGFIRKRSSRNHMIEKS